MVILCILEVKMENSKHLNTGQEESEDEPVAKIKCTEISSPRTSNSLNLCQLPNEMLVKIVAYIGISHYKNIRLSSRLLRGICDEAFMIKFRYAMKKYAQLNRVGAAIVLKAIDLATEAFIKSGFKSIFCACLSPILSKIPVNAPNDNELKIFLSRFYGLIKNRMNNEISKFEILYNITLIRFFKALKCSSVTITPWDSTHQNWKIFVELKVYWLTESSLYLDKLVSQSSDCNNIIHLLAKILKCQYANLELSQFSPRVLDAKTRIKFCLNMNGIESLYSLFRSCVEMNLKDFVWPMEWPTDEFNNCWCIMSYDSELRKLTKNDLFHTLVTHEINEHF
uniref:F-box domain-containing protein n=1 Tax=Glossina brevipalpis TaxID=37001 RepID=A0A1A9WP27_9MUSC